MKHLLGLSDLDAGAVDRILQVASTFTEISTRPIKKVPTLRGKTVINAFFEPSTRTRLSFEIAAKRLSADTFNIAAATSSLVKGESLVDTAKNLEAMRPDIVVIRHSHSGAPHLLARHIQTPVINAGDGCHEHPSQGLLDLLTVKEAKGGLAGLQVAIIGDIAHSRVAHSDIIGFSTMGAQVTVAGPGTLMPKGIESLGARVAPSVEEAVAGADVVIALRVQRERQQDPLIPSLRDYATAYGLNARRLAAARPDALVMHPGPVNWGVELDPDVMTDRRTVILEQVTNGVAVRMALLYLFVGGE
ncbi:MAG: aspartate carbamoyltransferase catalytic subunit [Thermodesulfobacteriota bacterium]